MKKIRNILTITGILLLGCRASKDSMQIYRTTAEAMNRLSPENEIIDANLRRFFIRKSSPKEVVRVIRNRDTIRYGDTIEIRDTKQSIRKIGIQGNYESPLLIEDLTPYVSVWKTYHENGNIKIKGFESWLGFYLGKQYWFDETGKTIKTKDWDIGYQFNFDNVLKFCRKNKIALNKYAAGPRCRVEKRNFQRGPAWYITGYYPGYTQNVKWVTIVLSGMTGKILEIALATVNAE